MKVCHKELRFNTFVKTLLMVLVFCGYPNLDALAQTEVKLIPPDGQLGDWFGTSAGIDGDYAVVGAMGEDGAGAAYVYELINGVWTEVVRLQGNDTIKGDNFASDAILSGDRIIIGARYKNIVGQKSGSAYVFERQNGVWTEMAQLLSTDLDQGDNFGQSVSIDGDIAIVGARRENSAGTNAGAAYIFEFDGSSWSQTAKIQSNDIQAEDRFGNAVSVSGERVLVGASGRAYVFEKDAGTWTQTAFIQADGIQIGDMFGNAVALSGDRAILGADDAVYVYDLIAGDWTETAQLMPTATDGADFFGNRVSLSGGRALVGAQNAGSGTFETSGAAYLFELDNGIWSQTAELTASDKKFGDRLGSAVAVSDVHSLAGAPGISFQPVDAGAAYIFTFSVPPTASFTFTKDDLEISFDASTSTDNGTITDWDWDFGDGNVGSGEFATHTYDTPGTYTVTLTVTDDDGDTDELSLDIDVGNPLPVPDFNATPVVGTLDVDFDASGSTDDGSIASWDWDFGDGNTGIGETILHTYAAAGTYNVTLTVTDDEGATGELSMDVDVVNEDPVASFVATPVTGTLDVDFDASGSTDDGSITSWDWDFGDGNTDVGETTAHTYAATGTYTVTLTVTDNLGVTNVLAIDVDVVNADPVAAFTATQVAGTLDVDFDASGSSDDGSITGWDWDFGDGNTDVGETISHIYAATGTYTVTLTVTDNLGVTNVLAIDVDVVNADPVAAFIATQVAGTLDVDFDASGSSDDGSITSWDWDFGDGNTDVGETISHTFAAAGTYTVMLTVTDNLGATGIVSIDVDVANDDPVASFTATQVAGTLDVDFDASSSSDDGSIASWDWDFGDGNTDTGETISHTFAAAGTYTVMLTVTDNLGATGVVSIDVDVVNENPVAAFTTTQTGGTLDVDFDASSSTDDGSITNWDWDFGDGNTDTGETISHTYAAAGTYTVMLTVTDNFGATGSASVDIDVVENQDPVASFTATQVAGILDVDFDGSASTDDGTIASWDWDFGDGNTDTGEIVTHTYAAPGTYTVALTVTDDVGATHVASSDVVVTDPNMPPVAAFTATQVSGTLDVDFDGSGSTDDDTIVSWDWDFGDGNTDTGETVTHTYATHGTFTAMLTVTDNVGATHAVSADVEVVDPNGPPVAAFTATQVAGTLDVDFDGSASTDDGTITSWDWDFGDGNTDTGTTISHSYAAEGTYTVVLTVTDDLGALGTLSVDVEVVANAAPVAAFTATQVTGTLDVDFDASGSSDDGSIASWDWDFGDGNTDVGETIAHTFAAAGTYTVMLTVTDNGGLTGSVSQDVEVVESSEDGPFVESGGMVVMEAENFHNRIDRGDHAWIENADNAGFSGTNAMVTDPDNGTNIQTDNETLSPELVYDIDITTTGDYHIWIRAWADDAGDNSVHLGVDGVIDPLSRGARWGVLDTWVWVELTRSSSSLTTNISTAGIHTLNLWMLLDGAFVDKLVMTTDANFVPSGEGPDESLRGAPISTTRNSGPGMDLLQMDEPGGIGGAAVAEIPETYGLDANYPNPFNPTTTIAFDLPEAADVQLEVFDMMGRRMATLVNGQLAAGKYKAIWNATSDSGAPLASGIYIYQIKTESFTEARRMILLK